MQYLSKDIVITFDIGFVCYSDVAISNQKPSKKMGLISGDMAASR